MIVQMMNVLSEYNNVTCKKYTDVTILALDLYGNSYKSYCHKIILARSSMLLDDLISLLTEEENNTLTLYLSNKSELDKFKQAIEFIYDKGEIDTSCIDCILKHQFHTCAYWLLKNKISDIENLDDIENLYSLVCKENLWSSISLEEKFRFDVIKHIFSRWGNFLLPFENLNKRLVNLSFNDVCKLIGLYKEENQCLDILSIFIIKWLIKNNKSLNLSSLAFLTNEINLIYLSRPFRKYWVSNLYLLGPELLDSESEKIIELMINKQSHSFKYDNINGASNILLSTEECLNTNYYINIENTFYNVNIKYKDGMFIVVLNSLKRYQEENVNMNILADININITHNHNSNWVHISGVFSTFPLKDTLVHNYDLSFLNNDNDNDGANDNYLLDNDDVVRINTNYFLKLK